MDDFLFVGILSIENGYLMQTLQYLIIPVCEWSKEPVVATRPKYERHVSALHPQFSFTKTKKSSLRAQ